MNLQFESENLFSGADWAFTESLSDYPATDYTLDIIIKKGTGSAVTLNGSADGDDFDFEKPADETAALGFGDFNYQAVATNIDTGKTSIIKSGVKAIHPLLTTSGDTRTYWEKIRDEAKEAYDKLAQLIAIEVNFKGKVIKYAQRSELLSTINLAEQKIQEALDLQAGVVTGQKTFKAIIN